MLNWAIRFLRRRFQSETEEALSAGRADLKPRDVLLQLQQAEARGWWTGTTSNVADTDEELVVIRPDYETPEELKALGIDLESWKSASSYVRHIYGLEDLLEGRQPRTPPLYLGLPYPMDGFEHRFEPIILAFVAARTDHKTALEELSRALAQHINKLAWFSDAETYSRWHR